MGIYYIITSLSNKSMTFFGHVNTKPEFKKEMTLKTNNVTKGWCRHAWCMQKTQNKTPHCLGSMSSSPLGDVRVCYTLRHFDRHLHSTSLYMRTTCTVRLNACFVCDERIDRCHNSYFNNQHYSSALFGVCYSHWLDLMSLTILGSCRAVSFPSIRLATACKH